MATASYVTGDVPADVKRNVEGAVKAMREYEPKWHECLAFLDNDQYVEVSAVTNSLDRLETREGGSKPRHRSRLTRNRYTPALFSEISMLINRSPIYDVQAPNGDPGAINQARLAEKVLLSVHEKLGLDLRTLEVLILAATTGAGFTWPFWDSSVGEYLGENLFTGEIGIHVLGQHELAWQSGVTFEESRYHIVRKAMDPEKVKQWEGYIGPDDLKADAVSGVWERGEKRELVFVNHYLERPSKKRPQGRWITIANDHVILKEQPYPRQVSDKPCIHKMAWFRRPHRHRDMGLGELLLDVQRTYNRTINQIIAWKNLVLNPQLLAPYGSVRGELTDEDGVLIEYKPVGGLKPEWREAPEIPSSLFAQLDQCVRDFEEIVGMRDLPAGVEAASAIEAVNERDQSRRAVVVKELARFYSDQGLHLLEIIQARYTEPRLLEVQGRFGVELIEDFVGRKIGCGIGSVRVSPASIEPRTKAAQEARLMEYADRGWIEPHQAMAAIRGGTAEALVDEFELDVARQHREIRDIIAIGTFTPPAEYWSAVEVALARGADPASIEMPMPKFPAVEQFDGHKVHRDVLRQWMKTRDWEDQPDLVKQVGREHYAQHEMAMQIIQQQEAAQTQAQAAGYGMENAASDQVAGTPDMRSHSEQTAAMAGDN